MSTRNQLIEQLLYSFHTIKNITKAKSLHLGHQGSVTHSQWFVLTMIEHFKKSNIKEIADALDMSSSAATQLVDVLVQVGLVIRQEDPNDRRSVQLELSPKGKKHIADTKTERINEMAEIFDGLTKDELEEFVRLHKKITAKP
jgi:DNA-binding MarR family transcriptional regulator